MELMEPKIWVDKISLPTYEVGKPNKNPLFLEKRVYQGSSGKIYPLPFTDTLSDEKKLKEYEVVFMENEFIQIMIMPEMGGKIYRALDKTNNYDFVYYNHVVKPALVGLTGPWVSGGIEINWPQHHRPSTFSPVEYTLEKNGDYSITCWISEIDKMYGTKGKAGFTLYKDKAYIEIKGQLYNRTEIPQTFLWWANPAVPANDNTKSIFPPDVHAVFDHGKRDVSKFPIATGTYYKMDYSRGVDISRYKNIPVPTSYMAYHSDYDFIGGYDFGVNAGIIHIANHHISPGKKQWTWGNGDFGKAWDRNLTDEDGPYIELMTGVYTDNQPDFSWLAPKEEKTFSQYFMPYKDVGEVKNANLDAIINLNIDNGKAYISLYVPKPSRNIKIVLTEKNDIIYEKEIEKLTPYDSFVDEINLFNEYSEEDYCLTIYDKNNKKLISYQPMSQKLLKTPAPAKALPEPSSMATCEDLYLAGLHLEQYRHATYSPDDYYLEALKRNSKDIRNNNAYGLLMYKRGRFDLAKKHFEIAVKSSTALNPNPYDSEPYYNLGLTLRKLGLIDEAYTKFYKSTWSSAWQNPGFYEIAAIDTIKKDYEKAIEHIEKAIIRNYHDIKARNLKISLLRVTGKINEAKDLALETLKIDNTSFATIYELCKLTNAYEDLIKITRKNPQNFIELTIDYGYVGLYEDAINIIDLYLKNTNENNHYPMLYYLKGYYLILDNKIMEGKIAFKKGNLSNSDYCFPHRLEELLALKKAIKENENDSKALYYLGNLYYDKKQYSIAIELWEKSINLNPNFPTAARNLALAYVNKKNDTKKGLYYLELAFSKNSQDARVFFELDQLYKKLGYPHKKRLSIMEKHMNLVESRDDLYVEYLTLLNNIGKYDDVINKISSRRFHPWEGGEGKVIAQYKRCRIELAKNEIINLNYEKAIILLNECKYYPENLGEGKLINTLENDINYLLGFCYEKMNKKDKSIEYYKLASVGIDEPTDAMYYNDQPADMMFYQGLAFKKLGEEVKALSEFNRMFDYGEKHISDNKKIDYFAVSLPDFLVFDVDLNIRNRVHCMYLMALGLLGKGDLKLATYYFNECLKLDPNHQGVLFHTSMNLNLIN